MVKYVVLLGVLAFAAPGMAVADDNQNNNSGAAGLLIKFDFASMGAIRQSSATTHTCISARP